MPNPTPPDFASLASLLGDSSRATVLDALMDGRARTATELAHLAHVAKPTISAHLEKLLAADLLIVERQGRHKYFRLRNDDVAEAIEALMRLASPARIVARPGSRSAEETALRRARSCYDHLAGRLGVELYEALATAGALAIDRRGQPTLTGDGEAIFAGLGIDLDTLRAGRRPLLRPCLDWSERRPHLAGALGAALLEQILKRRWARRDRATRALHFSALGEQAFRTAFELPAP